ncbi:Hypothetical protein, conserved [Brucella abortus str. 2308 A]|uniref:Uncharacterized protein n=6 Tax=Brucella TaxID=234 RepID=C0RFC3_BRUMB|nr:hypothetical protein BR1877 [Brucella suis 1330]ABY38737.1 Hypothetical protein, conserved [Brucella suis ATCC 23445]ACO01595.1 Hypothetical protein, conserved [Brucella melitensis ATCC 23457]ACU48839.1 hypothetical protein BMI_I1897 [Brucella microti CCM 4915]AEK55165.1 hypothetical protein BPI_I1937 [Brucella pinnipedialis B2/94]AEU06859.1 hypothetical protein BSVBI22_A1873 [Brucella suis VBI22]AHN47464.1 hypothetical protein BSS2_I1815 [Brucella suis bv. 1 str. S2]EEH13953.1 Hypothetic
MMTSTMRNSILCPLYKRQNLYLEDPAHWFDYACFNQATRG